MAIGRTNAVFGGGGGAGLNFSVKAYESETAFPSVEKENTIGVITGVDITSWIFSATEPTAHDEGVVWFPTGTSSAVAFNALKKNSVEVYPTFAKQWVSGEWVTLEAKIYQNGKWVAFKTNILLDMSFNKTYNHGNKVSFHSPTADEPYLTVTTTYENSSAQGKLTVCTDKTYDLTGVNTIEFVVDKWTLGNTQYPLKIGVCSAVPTTLNATIHPALTITQSITEPVTLPLPVDEVSGPYYIAVKSEGSTTDPKTTGGTISGIYFA